MMIDLNDCDRLFPSIYEFQPGQSAEDVNTTEAPFLENTSMIELSIQLGHILKLLYSPSPLSLASEVWSS